MSENYTHLLIAKPKDFVPTPSQVQEFLSESVARGVIPTVEAINVLTPSQRTRSVENPFTGKTEIFPIKDWRGLSRPVEIANAVVDLTDYQVFITGVGRPLLPPLPVDFDTDYYVTVRCCVSSKTCATYYLEERDDGSVEVPFIGESCSPESSIGYFADPDGGPAIEVPDAGCARFWIQIELGKWLFPIFEDRNLNILNPEIASWAARQFGVPFVQGYHWG